GCSTGKRTQETQDFFQASPLAGLLQLPRVAPKVEYAAALEGLAQERAHQCGPISGATVAKVQPQIPPGQAPDHVSAVSGQAMGVRLDCRRQYSKSNVPPT